jgi:hypothetical protein
LQFKTTRALFYYKYVKTTDLVVTLPPGVVTVIRTLSELLDEDAHLLLTVRLNIVLFIPEAVVLGTVMEEGEKVSPFTVASAVETTVIVVPAGIGLPFRSDTVKVTGTVVLKGATVGVILMVFADDPDITR